MSAKPTTTDLVVALAETQLMTRDYFWNLLRQTVIPHEFTDEQTMIFLSVANRLGLDPLNGEIYPAIIDGKVQCLQGIDGWLKRLNCHPQYDGMQAVVSPDGTECTVTIHRKDRTHPTVITEYLSECKKDKPAWHSHPRRMIRHRTIIQGTRVAIGSGGVMDADDRHYFQTDFTDETKTTPLVETGAGSSTLAGKLKDSIDQSKKIDPEPSMKVEPEPSIEDEKQEDPPERGKDLHFTTVKGMTCATEKCRNRLIRKCDGCDDHYCSICLVEATGFCSTCLDAVNSAKEKKETETQEVEPAPEKPSIDERLRADTKPPAAEERPRNKTLAELRAEKHSADDEDMPY